MSESENEMKERKEVREVGVSQEAEQGPDPGGFKFQFCETCKHDVESCYDKVGLCNERHNKWEPKGLGNHDPVNHPPHYTQHPSGIECIQITEHMSFTLGNAVKYIWRADLKNGVEDLKKAIWYIEREIAKREDK